CASSCSVVRATVRAVASPAMRRATCGSSGRSCLRRRPGRSRAGDRARLVVVCSSTREWYEPQGDSAQRSCNIHVVMYDTNLTIDQLLTQLNEPPKATRTHAAGLDAVARMP